MLYERQGRYAEAEPLYLRALAIYERQLGLLHPTTITVREHYIDFLRGMHREAEAMQLERRSKDSSQQSSH